LLADGIYSDVSLKISTSNILLKSTTPGGVLFTNNSSITIEGDYITISGFQFVECDNQMQSVVEISGNYNTISDINIKNCNSEHFLTIKGGS